ncbi:SAM-dependent methyltransferase [Allocatelliglobosispora scoriae]|uniref:SAM-dependent methyltransferase n=1 Tax=Allocatelliglobosispora scoriae TaxID=643052 RepID=A0A841C4G7_9ACTN|nr:class I SAM-dependent methyltransferase [Allocatelliglobosispora scoriae]MBB5874033.1 SAM-dependent methyltransferase [Allocatelliglobosispora scoriae]
MVREGYSGSGPGAFTPDGCAVEVYERMPVGAEPDVIEQAAPAGASILELGSGAGRVTHPLVERGFAVTAVDESAEMLAKVRGARTVHSSIEDLHLGERFDVVLLGSFLVHAPSGEQALALLSACARHVAPGGCVLLQREGASWHENLPRVRHSTGGKVTVASSTEVGPGVRSVVVEYAFPDARWTHTFLSRPLSEADLDELLRSAGLTFDGYLTEDLTWVRALPAPAAP